jgi:hypothetical protein
MTTMQILDTAGQHAISGVIGALSSQMGAAHQAANAVTAAIFPPTWDSASTQAVAQQAGNTAEFSAMLTAGLGEMAKVAALVEANNVGNLGLDAATAAATTAASA